MRYSFLLGCAMLVATPQVIAEAPPTQRYLQQKPNPVITEITRIAETSKSDVGFAAVHIESGEMLGYNDHKFYPMASTYKVPLAVTILSLVAQGKLNLNDVVPITETERVMYGPISKDFIHPGVSLSIHNLLEVMITQSDNTATDVLFRVAGEPAAVTKHMQSLGINNLHISSYTRDLIKDTPQKSDTELNLKDHGTPADMTRLLQKVWKQEGVSAAAKNSLWEIMQRTSIGENRIRGKLPPGTVVGDKTGSLKVSLNDTGIIELPDNKGHVALSIYVKGADIPNEIREEVIADISRLVYDYFLLSKNAPEKIEAKIDK